MDIRRLTPDYAVSPQIAPEDLAQIKAEGFTTVIDNRPDAEIPADLHASAMRAAVRRRSAAQGSARTGVVMAPAAGG